MFVSSKETSTQWSVSHEIPYMLITIFIQNKNGIYARIQKVLSEGVQWTTCFSFVEGEGIEDPNTTKSGPLPTRQRTILMKYHSLFVNFEKAAKLEIVVCCKL